MIVKGTFEVQPQFEPPYEEIDGVSLGRATFGKTYEGPLQALGTVQMLAVRTPVPGSAVYVAVERVDGELDGKRGTFVLAHRGLMTRGTPSLDVTIAPDSGTGELRGISGKMKIDIIEKKHFYELEYGFE
jgi:hypothetical protein